MDPLSITAGIVGVVRVFPALFSYLNDVNDGPKERAKYAVEASNMYSFLTSLRYQLEASKGAEGWYSKVRQVAADQGPLAQFKEALELLVDKLTDKGKANKVTRTLLWSLHKRDVEGIMDQLEPLKSHIQGILKLAQLEITVSIKSSTEATKRGMKDTIRDTGFIKEQLPSIQKDVDRLYQSQNDEKRQIILDWLSSSDHSAQQPSIMARRQSGTGHWFMSAPELNTWLTQS